MIKYKYTGPNLEARLITHEGMKSHAYKDTMGILTIGIGRNIDKLGGKGLSEQEMLFMCNNDIEECRKQLSTQKFYMNLDNDVRKDAIVEMCFNLGFPKLMDFRVMIESLETKNYTKAVADARNSRWATQIDSERIDDIMYRLEHGIYPE